MKTLALPAGSGADLRRRAEQRLRLRAAPRPAPAAAPHPQRLIQELQIHQIELELQNEELTQAKAEAEANLEKFTDLYDFAPVGYFTLGPDSTIHLVNLTGASLVGINRSRLVRTAFATLLAADSRPAFRTFLQRVFATTTNESGEFALHGDGDTPRIVSIKAQCLSHGGECRAAVVDVTAHQRAEAKVRLSELRYRRLFEASHDGVLLLDPNTRRITDANPFMTRLLGYPARQLVGKELYEIGLLRDAAASREMVQRLKRDHEVRYEDLPLETRAGRHQEVEVMANLYVEGGQAVIQCNLRDITVRKHAEALLRRNEALFTSLVEQAPVGVYVVDAAFHLLQVNPRARTAFQGIHPLVGRDFAEVLRLLWPRRIASQIDGYFRRTLETGLPYQAPELTARRRGRRAPETYEWQIQRVTLPAGEQGVVCFFSDITARKAAEGVQRRLEMLTASNQKLEREIIRRRAVENSLKQSESRTRQLLAQSHRLQKRLRHFSHQILLVQENQRKEISRELHDKICQLLVGINVQLAVFTRDAAIAPWAIRQTVAPLRRHVARAVKVVHQFARELRPAVLDDLGLIPALRAYLAEFPRQRGRTIAFTAFAGVEALENDHRTVLYRIAQEALTNVHKHANARVVKVTIFKAKGGVCLEISDNGRAFDVERLTSARGNRRLGLVGMRERVEMIGGRFSVDSQAGVGTTIRAEIPFGRKRRPLPV